MIGYHTTAGRNVPSILDRGLIPYKIHKSWVDTDWRGIWVWDERPTGIDWVHIALQRWLDHQDPRVALFAVEYERDDTVNPRGHIFDIAHSGTVQGTDPHPRWVYHEGVMATIIWTPVPPARLLSSGWH